MSSAEVRTELAAAATVAGVTNVTTHLRQVTKAGEGCIRLDRIDRSDNRFGYMATWQVLIFLPQDVAAAEKWMDDNLTTLVDAVSEALIVTSAAPMQVPLDAGTVPALVIEGARAHE